MSETTSSAQDLRDQDRWYLDDLFVDNYQFLERLFPGSVHATERPYEIAGRSAQEFILRVGEPMDAADVFGYGRSLEVGGPSPYETLRTVKGALRPTIVTNISAGEGVDQIADASALDFPDSSFATVLAVGLPYFRDGSNKAEPNNLRSRFINEAHRVLEPGGMLLMAGASKEDLSEALELGFAIELGNGCIMSHLAAIEDSLDIAKKHAVPVSMNIEFLLHK